MYDFIAASSTSDGALRFSIRYVSFISMLESTVNRDVAGEPLELSSTYFFVAASVLALGAATFF